MRAEREREAEEKKTVRLAELEAENKIKWMESNRQYCPWRCGGSMCRP